MPKKKIIEVKPKRIGHTKENVWSVEDEAYLAANYPTGSLTEICDHLGRTYQAVRNKAVMDGLKRSERYWSAGDEKWLLKNWEKMTAVELGKELGKTRFAVINKFRELTGKRPGHKKLKL